MALSTVSLLRWFDLHTHFRQGENVARYIQDHIDMGCAGALAMPNTLPPVSAIDGPNLEDAWSIEGYRDLLLAAGADQFEELIVPLYLTRKTTPRDIGRGSSQGLLKAAKYYPPHGTTNSAHGVPMEEWIGSEVFRAMEDCGVILCIHGEQHGLTGGAYFDDTSNAESRFYREWMPRLLDRHPDLRIVCEHITTETAVAFVQSADPGQVGATITPQHLLFTVGDLIQGLRYHLYCLPVVKFSRDRAALRSAIADPSQRQFFAGTDSAPHTRKATECGCAAGCYTGGCAPQLYAMGFTEAGVDPCSEIGRDAFINFISLNGPRFYGFPPSKQLFRLTNTPSTVEILQAPDGPVTPLPLGMDLDLTWSIA